MGFDKIINIFTSVANKNKFIKDDNLKEHIKKEFHYTSGSTCLYTCLLPWHGRFKDFARIKKEAIKAGFSFLAYRFPAEILSSDYNLTKKCYEKIQNLVCEDLKKLKKQYAFSKFNLISVSISCVNACMIANNYPGISKIILIVPGNCLAESLWKGVRTQHIKKQFEIDGVSLKQLKKYWFKLAPEHNISKLKNVEVQVYLSKSDEIIPYECGKKLVSSMKNSGLSPFVEENRLLGHYFTGLRHYLFPKRIIWNSEKDFV